MNNIATDQLHEILCTQLDPYVRSRIKMKIAEFSDALSIKVDGDNCLTSIGVWTNGCCDVEYLFVATEQGEFRHFEFENLESALPIVLQEVNLAVQRA